MRGVSSAAGRQSVTVPVCSPFSRAFVRGGVPSETAPSRYRRAEPSSRGNGKSWLCGSILARALTPGDPLFEPAVENVLVAASREQAGIVLDFARAALGEVGRLPLGEEWRDPQGESDTGEGDQ